VSRGLLVLRPLRGLRTSSGLREETPLCQSARDSGLYPARARCARPPARGGRGW
jgi:hypothetical protein